MNKSKSMLTKINFPKEAIMIAKLGEIAFDFSIKLVLIIMLFLFYGISLGKFAILAPIGLFFLVLFGFVCGLMLVPIGSLYEDVSRALTSFVGLWFFLTPVIYPVPNEGLFASIVRINPVTPLLVTTKELATGAAVSQPEAFIFISVLSIFGLVVSWILYRISIPILVERMSA